MNKLSPVEEDIILSGTRLFDYFYDIMLVQNKINNKQDIGDLRLVMRKYFGEATLQLVKNIETYLKQNNE